MKYYNGALFYDVQRDYIGRVVHSDKPPTSIYEILEGPTKKYFNDEMHPTLKHDRFGTVSTANIGPNMNNSNFFMTLSQDPIQSLDGKHTIFGLVGEGHDVLQKINEAFVDQDNRPFVNIRILHTVVLEDPFDDPPGLTYPDQSPEIVYDAKDRLDVGDKIELLEDKGRTEEEIIEATKEHEAKTKAIVLEMLNDLPDADIKPPDNILFVCKLNPVTQESDLEAIFSRFGPIKSCDIIRDWKTGQSLQYAFIEFETAAAREEAYFKMENALIDERRIHVDFSQSVSKLWNSSRGKKGGAKAGGGGGARPAIELRTKLTREDDKYQMVFDEGDEPQQHDRRENKSKRYEGRDDRGSRKPRGSPKRDSRKNRSKSRSRSNGKRRSRSRSRSNGKYRREDNDRRKYSKRREDSHRDRKRSRSRSRSGERKRGRSRSRSGERRRDNRDKRRERDDSKDRNKKPSNKQGDKSKHSKRSKSSSSRSRSSSSDSSRSSSISD